MIPSDQFVLFYNEIFKELEARGKSELNRYYARVAERQYGFMKDLLDQGGLKGLYEYNERIRVEENCVMKNEMLPDGGFHTRMLKCPSISKALASDAGPCRVYCDHCPGWILRVMTKVGYYEVYNLMSRTSPECEEFVYRDRESALKKYRELVAEYGGDLIFTNALKIS